MELGRGVLKGDEALSGLPTEASSAGLLLSSGLLGPRSLPCPDVKHLALNCDGYVRWRTKPA